MDNSYLNISNRFTSGRLKTIFGDAIRRTRLLIWRMAKLFCYRDELLTFQKTVPGRPAIYWRYIVGDQRLQISQAP